MAYLRVLSEQYQVTLITFEKSVDAADSEAMAYARADCEAHGIRWLPQRFYHRPKGLAPVWSMVVFFWLCLREVLQGRANLIHARSYIPAAVALLVHRLTGVPFIFDMRALWPEELITAGRLRRGSLIHKTIVWIERACLKRAAAVVSLTHAATEYLHKVYPDELAGKEIDVIPTCADLDRFVPAGPGPGVPRIYGCVGTVLSGWFKLDWLAAFFHAAATREPDVEFHIITRDDPDRVRAALGGNVAFQARLSVYGRSPLDVHEAVQQQNVSAMFFTEGLSKLGSSPTRLAEILGCGLPVVANAGVGDVAWIIAEHKVGVLVDGPDEAAMIKALDELAALEVDSGLATRCRTASEAMFSLSGGTASYLGIYGRILGAPDLASA